MPAVTGSPRRKGDSFLRAWVFQAHCTLRASPRRGQRSLAHVGLGEGICQGRVLLVTLCDRLCVCPPVLGSERRPVWGRREPSSTSGGGVWGGRGLPIRVPDGEMPVGHPHLAHKASAAAVDVHGSRTKPERVPWMTGGWTVFPVGGMQDGFRRSRDRRSKFLY